MPSEWPKRRLYVGNCGSHRPKRLGGFTVERDSPMIEFAHEMVSIMINRRPSARRDLQSESKQVIEPDAPRLRRPAITFGPPLLVEVDPSKYYVVSVSFVGHPHSVLAEAA
jgi:hypothetical protein